MLRARGKAFTYDDRGTTTHTPPPRRVFARSPLSRLLRPPTRPTRRSALRRGDASVTAYYVVRDRTAGVRLSATDNAEHLSSYASCIPTCLVRRLSGIGHSCAVRRPTFSASSYSFHPLFRVRVPATVPLVTYSSRNYPIKTNNNSPIDFRFFFLFFFL